MNEIENTLIKELQEETIKHNCLAQLAKKYGRDYTTPEDIDEALDNNSEDKVRIDLLEILGNASGFSVEDEGLCAATAFGGKNKKVRTLDELIMHCFEKHKTLHETIKFTYEQYDGFWKSHKLDDQYSMRSRDGSVVTCKVAYYPLPNHPDLRALIEIKMENAKGTNDFREVPVHYLEKIIVP